MTRAQIPDFYDCNEMAFVMSVPVRTVRHWALTGTGPIKATRFGNQWFWPVEDVVKSLQV